MSDFNTISDNDFMVEKIKERPINRKKLIRKTVITVTMAVIFGLVACVTFISLEPIITNYLYPEEEAEVITFPEDEEEMKPEDMLEEEIPVIESIPQEPVNTQLDQEQVDEILNAVTLDKSHYLQLYDVMSEYVSELSQYMVTVTSVKEDFDWLENSYETTNNTSGVVIAKNNKDIFILTDYTSLEGADEIYVTFYNGKEREANLLGAHSEVNIAVLNIPLEVYGTEDEVGKVAVAPLGSSRSYKMTGKPIVAMGSPMGMTDSIGYGIIAAMTEEVDTIDFNYDVIVTDIYGSPSAKGVLFNMQGQIIGIITSTKTNLDVKSIVTAYGISDLKQMISAISSGKEIPYLGIKGTDVEEDADQEAQIPEGTYILDVVMNSPAMLAGLQKGDIIVGMDENTIEDYADFARAMYGATVGQTMTITLMRPSQGTYKEMSMDVTLTSAN